MINANSTNETKDEENTQSTAGNGKSANGDLKEDTVEVNQFEDGNEGRKRMGETIRTEGIETKPK